jgi:Tol biopolymer transport system component/tRNA A-37 threonylcarbamoyl transferase component Bud32
LIGQTLGHYEITDLLGKGGMGEVYRARDATLGRDVAIKILSTKLSEDPESSARFAREARTLASLQHPNVASIYGFEEVDGTRFLVMELVEGDDLAHRLKNGALAIHDAVTIASQIAQGLEDAHEKGIIHRDLKPANVKVMRDGTVKILDFGLAKAMTADSVEHDLSNSPTITEGMTRTGIILGTAAYMSPEQARGQGLDRRTDIWSFGCVLYEMLAGKAPFKGRTVTDVIAEIMKSEPSWDELPEDTPGHVRTLVWRCLQKDPRERLRDIGEARFCLSTPEPFPTTGVSAAQTASKVPRHRGWVAAIAVASFLVGAVVVGTGLQRMTSEDVDPTLRFIVEAPEGRRFTPPRRGGDVAFSPDGRHLAFVAGSNDDRLIWIRDMNSSQCRELSGTNGARNPFWSPDGRIVAYFTGTDLKVVPMQGGKSRTLCNAQLGRGGTWAVDGTIIFAPNFDTGLWRVNAREGSASVLTRLDQDRAEKSHRWPVFLPDGRHYLYLAWSQRPEDSAVFLGDLHSSEHRLLVSAQSNAVLAPEGYLVYSDGMQVLAVRFDLDRFEILGEPFHVAPGIDQTDLLESAFLPMTASVNGTLAYETFEGDPSATNVSLVRYDLTGEHGPVIAPGIRDPALSPNGRWIAGNRTTPENSMWLLNLGAGTESKFVFDTHSNFMPVWSPDGSQIVFASNRATNYDLYIKPSNGSADERLLLSTDGSSLPTSWSSDGRWVLYHHRGESMTLDLWVFPMFDEGDPQLYLGTDAEELQGEFSPDGKWVAYCSNESDQWEIYVQPFPATGGKWLVSSRGGTQPRWRGDGKQLFYLSPDDYIVAVDIDISAGAVKAGAPQPLFPIPNPPGDASNTDEFVATKDGKAFYATVELEEEDPYETRRIMVVIDWTQELMK